MTHKTRSFSTASEGAVYEYCFEILLLECAHSRLVRLSSFNCLVKICCRCVQQINKAGRGELSPAEMKERQVSFF